MDLVSKTTKHILDDICHSSLRASSGGWLRESGKQQRADHNQGFTFPKTNSECSSGRALLVSSELPFPVPAPRNKDMERATAESTCLPI